MEIEKSFELETTRDHWPEPPRVSRFLSRADVARLFGVSLSTVTRWARTGVIQTVRTPGGHYRYLAEDVRRVAGLDLGPMATRADG